MILHIAAPCGNLAALDIKIGVLPDGQPLLAVLLLGTVGQSLTALSLTNHSNLSTHRVQLDPIVGKSHEVVYNYVGMNFVVISQMQLFAFIVHYGEVYYRLKSLY